MRRRAFLQGVGAATGAGVLPRVARAARPAALDRLRAAEVSVGARAAPLGADLHDGVTLELGVPATARRQLPSGAVDVRAAPVPGDPDAVDLFATFRPRAGAPAGALAIRLEWASWSVENYLLLPGCCYAGNRFESRFAAYPPLLAEPADIGPHVPPIVTDIPRLNRHAGPSRLDVASGELASPALAVFAPGLHLGVILLVDPTSGAGPTGLTVAEAEDRRRATMEAGTPFVRDSGRDGGGAREKGPRASGFGLRVPDQTRPVTLRARVLAFACDGIPALLARLFAVRKALTTARPRPASVAFSALFAFHEARVNSRWVDKLGVLALGDRSTAYTTWQNGWCGGLGLTAPLLAAGAATSRERATRTTEFALAGQGPTGFFHAVSDGTHWYDDGFTAPLPGVAKGGHARWHLVRRTADMLFYLLDQIAWFERSGPRGAAGAAPAVDPRWMKAARHAADALANLWERHRQFGQIVDVETGELIVGGSSAAGLAPAALAHAADRFKEARYREIALEAGRTFFERFVAGGLTCGGPGDALQCPDSESAAALLESFMTLHGVTGDRTWVERARTAAHLLASWVLAADGETCADGSPRLAGAVIPDAQNRQPGPGLVLFGGDALLRLARATGDRGYLELLRDLVRQVGQRGQLRGDDRPPVRGGEATLRAEVVPQDGVLDAIALLATTRVPSVYAQVDKPLVFAFDAVEARVKERMPGRLLLSLRNPTDAEAHVRVMAETGADADRPLPPATSPRMWPALVPAGGSVDLVVPPLDQRGGFQ